MGAHTLILTERSKILLFIGQPEREYFYAVMKDETGNDVNS